MRSHGYAAFVVVVVTVLMATALVSGCPDPCECRPRAEGVGTIVDCRGRRLTSVVSGLPADATELDIGDNLIGFVNRSSFPSGSRLRVLRLDGCRLDRLDGMVFRNLQQLQTLDLSRNRIRVVSASSFYGHAHLRVLNLSGNSIETLPDFVLRSLNLTELDLSENELHEIPIDLFRLVTAIQKLNLDGNRLPSLARQSLVPLEQNIRTLSVSNNRNPLSIASDTFSGADLTALLLANSGVSDVSFLGTTTAGHIDLSGNNLTNFTLQRGSGGGLARSCRELVLRDVRLESLDDSVFANLPLLERLDLSGNLLTSFRPDLFRHMQDLRAIDFSRNRFVRIPDDFGPQMHRLENLNFSYCEIESINWANLGTMVHLNSLDLSGNRLQVIPENASGLLDSIETLDLSQNPWHCNCEMRWFRRWLATNARRVGLMKCSSPQAGVPMLDLAPENYICTPATITRITPSQSRMEGDFVTLSCAAQSDPAPAIVWRAPFGDVVTITPPDDRTQTLTTAVFTLHQIKPDKSGWFSCNATNLMRTDITYTYVQVVTSAEEATDDLGDLEFPMTPSTRSRQSTMGASTSPTPKDLDAVTTDQETIGEESSAPTSAPTPEHLPRRETTTKTDEKRLETVTQEADGVDEVDGYWTLPVASSEQSAAAASVREETSPPVGSSTVPEAAEEGYSSERSAGGAGGNDAEAQSTSRAPVVVTGVILGVLVTAVIVIVMAFVVYRRRRHRDYPVKEKQRRSSRDEVSEKTKLQMSNLDDSCCYSSTVTDPLNQP